MSFLLYGLILASVFRFTSRAAEPGEAVLSRLSITLFVSPFIAIALIFVLKAVGLNQFAGELFFWLGLVFTFVSWVAAGIFALVDVFSNIFTSRDK